MGYSEPCSIQTIFERNRTEKFFKKLKFYYFFTDGSNESDETQFQSHIDSQWMTVIINPGDPALILTNKRKNFSRLRKKNRSRDPHCVIYNIRCKCISHAWRDKKTREEITEIKLDAQFIRLLRSSRSLSNSFDNNSCLTFLFECISVRLRKNHLYIAPQNSFEPPNKYVLYHNIIWSSSPWCSYVQ